ncbi:MAG: DUF2341 domain-containing protein, partial [Planctomycetota bacterium]
MGTDRVFDFYPLEDRILLSGEGLDGVDAGIDADPTLTEALLADIDAEGEAAQNGNATLPASENAPSPNSDSSDTETTDQDGVPVFDPAKPLEVVFIDAAVEDAETLIEGLQNNSGETQWLVIELSADQDGIAQISSTLAQLSGVDAIHLISHGDQGGIQLGNTRLSDQSIDAYAADLAGWSNALDGHADLLIYGCDLASTEEGEMLVDELAALTGADVAASEDLTGHSSLGGDWDLEYQTGFIDVLSPFSLDVQAAWMHVLTTTLESYEPSFSDLSDTGYEVQSGNSWGQTFQHNSGNGTFDMNQVALVLSKDGGAPSSRTVTISIRNSWNGTILGSGTISTDDLTTSEAWYDIDVGSITLNDSTTYVIQVDTSSAEKVYIGVDDSSPSYSGGTLIDSGGSASSGEDFAFRIQNANTAPILTGSNSLTTISEDAISNGGTLVSNLISGFVSDADSGALEGIAVFAVDDTNGTWEYTINGGSTWTAFGSVDESNARLLASDANTSVRFVPNADWNGTVSDGISFRAWDQFTGTAGGTADVSSFVSTVRDEFSSAGSFSGNDGTVNWSTNWIEFGETDGANSGSVEADGTPFALEFGGDETSINNEGVYRSVDLSAATSATFSYDVWRDTEESGGSVWVQVSDDGGSSWATLDVYYFNSSTPNSATLQTYDISSYISADTRVRFVGSGTTGEDGNYIYFDNVQVEYTAANAGGSTAFSAATAASDLIVTAVNDAPVAGDDSYSVDEDQSLSVGADTTSNLNTWYDFSDGSGQTLSDVSGNSNDATLGSSTGSESSDPTWTTSSRTGGSALEFDGSTDYVSTNVDLRSSNSFTLSTWFKTDSTTAQQHLLWQGASGENGWGLIGGGTSANSELHLSIGDPAEGNKIKFFMGYDSNDADSIFVTSTNDFTDTTGWHLATVVVSDLGGGTLQADLYIDGVLEGSDTGTQNDRSAWLSTMNIGSPDAATRRFDGQIDEIQVFDRSLSGTDVAALYSGAGGILDNDSDVEGSAVTAVLVSGPSNGSLTLNSNGSFDYTPDADFSGTDSFTYTANDGTVDSGIATVTITVNPINDSPVILNNSTAEVSEGSTGNAITTSMLNEGDVDDFGAGLTYTITDATDNGTLYLSGFGALGLSDTFTQSDIDAGSVTYDHDGSATTSDSFNFSLADGGENGSTPATGTFSFSITAMSAPVANADNYSVDEDSSLVVDWWNANWTRRQELTFDNSGQASNLDDFPVLITLDSTVIDYGQTQSAGQDLRFFDADGTALAYEIEEWNESGESFVWVRIPRIDAGSSSDSITIYYGNASAAAGESPESVWNSEFTLVQHFNETSGTHDGSTSGDHDAVNFGSNQNASGLVSGANNLDGNDDYLSVAHNDDLNVGTEITVSALVNIDAGGLSGWDLILNKGTTGSNETYFFGLNGDEVMFGLSNGGFPNVTSSGVNLTTGTWYALAATFNDATNEVKLYVDGVEVATGSITESMINNTEDLLIGRSQYGEYFNGTIDEVRIYDQVQTADWLAAQSLSMRNDLGSEFVSFGGEQVAPANGGVLGNDTDADGDSLSATLISGPTNSASFNFNSDGTFSYTPLGDFSGTDTFTYEANDGSLTSAVTTVTITVNPINDAPTIATNTGATFNEGSTGNVLTTAMLNEGDVDDSGAGLVYTVTDVTDNGTLTLSGFGTLGLNDTFTQADIDAGNLSYTHDGSETTGDAFSFSLADGGEDGVSAAAGTFSLTITPINDEESLDTNAGLTLDEGTAGTITSAELLASDNDNTTSQLVYTVDVTPTNGELSLNWVTLSATDTFTQADIDAGLIRYRHDGGETTSDTFEFTVDDGTGSTTSATFTLTVNPVNDAPVNMFTGLPQVTASSGVDGATDVHAADIDGDGDIDLVSTSWTDDRVTWFQNDGAGNFTEYTVATGVSGARHVFVADLDGDGHKDLIVSAYEDDTVTWYENDGGTTPTFTARTITSSADGAWSSYAIDMDGDGDLDVLSASIFDDKVAWYENDGSAIPAWTEHVIGTADGVRTVVAGDLDDDGDIDVATASFLDSTIAWFESDGAATPGFTKQVISTNTLGAMSVEIADVNADGDLDLVTASYSDGKIAWFQNDGATDPSFSEQVVSTSAAGARDVTTADLDGDGDLDIISASFIDDKFAWYENDGQSTPSFTERLISLDNDGPRAVAVADFNGDGDLDVAGASLNDDQVGFFQNTDGQMGIQQTAEDTPLVFSAANSNLLWISDTDAGSSEMSVRLEITNGSISLSGTTGLTFDVGDGLNDAVVEFRGSLADINSALDGLTFTPTADFNGIASIRVITDDQGNSGSGGALTDDDTINITVAPVNDSPVIATNTGMTVNEGSTNNVITTAMLNEGDVDDGGAGLTYTVTSVPANGTLSLSGFGTLGLNDTFTQADIDAGNVTYDHNGSETTSDTFNFTLSDGGEDGSTSASGTFNIAITPVNDHSISAISDSDGSSDFVLENASNGTVVGVTAFASDTDAGDTITYSLDDDDGGRFTINSSTGVVTVAGSIDRETDGANRSIVVRATSSDTSTTTQGFTIAIGDVDEFDVGAVSDSDVASNAVDENASNGTVVGVTALASDADATNNAITYTLDDDAGGRFAINSSTGVVTVADGTLLDREAAASHDITIRATSSDGSFNTATMTIALNDVDEFDVGTVTDSDATINAVDENAANGTVVGVTALASDADATNSTITYTLDDDASGRFTINSSTGVVTVADGTLLDREAAASH